MGFQPRWPTSINAKVPAILKSVPGRKPSQGLRVKKITVKLWHPQLTAINYNFRMLSRPSPVYAAIPYTQWPDHRPVSPGFMMLMEKIPATAWLQGVRQFPAHVSVSVSVSVSARSLSF